MRSMIRTFALISLASATTALAQGPVPPMEAPQGGPVGPSAAGMLLAHTGELGLTDAQVVRLAAIARRTETRRAALRSAMDSARQRFQPGQPADSAARRQFRQRMQTDMEKARDAGRVDLRDAIAVLNADQQARAWEMAATRGRMARHGAMRERGMGMRERGMGMRERQRMQPRDPGFRGRRPMDDEQRGPRPRRVPPDSESR